MVFYFLNFGCHSNPRCAIGCCAGLAFGQSDRCSGIGQQAWRDSVCVSPFLGCHHLRGTAWTFIPCRAFFPSPSTLLCLITPFHSSQAFFFHLLPSFHLPFLQATLPLPLRMLPKHCQLPHTIWRGWVTCRKFTVRVLWTRCPHHTL